MPYCTKDETGWTYWLTPEDMKRIGLDPGSPSWKALQELVKGD